MAHFLVTASNPGMTEPFWNENINSIQDAFNASASVNGFRRITTGSWLVETKDDTTINEVRDLVTSNLAYIDASRRTNTPVEVAVVSMNSSTEFTVHTRDAQAAVDYWKLRKLQTAQPRL